MKRALIIWTFLIPVIFAGAAAFSQNAALNIDRSDIRMGEQTILRIHFDYRNPDEDALIGWPQFDEMLTDKIEIVDKTADHESLLDTASQTFRREQQLTITAFEPGTYEIPPLEIELNDSVYRTNSAELVVNGVEIDTAKGIVDIQPNYEVTYPFTERVGDFLKNYWHWFAIGGAVIALFLLVRLIKNRRPEKPEPEAPKIPAHIPALAVLHELLREERWKQPDKKEYYSKLTDTVRLYLEQRFGIFAMEKTTREIIGDLKKADITEDDKQSLRKILNKADMVKFAKMTPSDEDGFVSLSQSIEFVERTKILEVDPATNPGTSPEQTTGDGN
jgi:hypothetical protein